MKPSCSTSSARSAGPSVGRHDPRQTPHLGEQLTVPRIAAVDLDRQRAVSIGPGELDDPLGSRSAPARGPRPRRRGPAVPARCATSSVDRPVSRRQCTAASNPMATATIPPAGSVAPRNADSDELAGDHPPADPERLAHMGRGRRDRRGRDRNRARRERRRASGVGELLECGPGIVGADSHRARTTASTIAPAAAASTSRANATRRRTTATTSSSNAQPTGAQNITSHSGSKNPGNDASRVADASSCSARDLVQHGRHDQQQGLATTRAMSVGRRTRGSSWADAKNTTPTGRAARHRPGCAVSSASAGS